MIGWIRLEVYNPNLNITEAKNKFVIYIVTFDEFSFEEFKDEFEENLSFSDITPPHLQHEKIGLHIIQTD